MWAIIGTALQIMMLLLKKWFEFNDEKKQKAKEILKEAKDAKTASDYTRIFDGINRL